MASNEAVDAAIRDVELLRRIVMIERVTAKANEILSEQLLTVQAEDMHLDDQGCVCDCGGSEPDNF